MTDQMVAHQAHILAGAAWSFHDLHDRSAGNEAIAVCPAITKYVPGNWGCSPTALAACQCDVVLAACCSELACRCGCTTPAPLHETRQIVHAPAIQSLHFVSTEFFFSSSLMSVCTFLLCHRRCLGSLPSGARGGISVPLIAGSPHPLPGIFLVYVYPQDRCDVRCGRVRCVRMLENKQG